MITMEDVRRETSSLRAILEPFMYHLDEDSLLFAPMSDFLIFRPNGIELKLYIIETKEKISMKCTCGEFHIGFQVKLINRNDNKIYLAFQPDLPCTCQNTMLFEFRE
jgi:hypothetical protein